MERMWSTMDADSAHPSHGSCVSGPQNSVFWYWMLRFTESSVEVDPPQAPPRRTSDGT